jgi:hypothetical protein
MAVTRYCTTCGLDRREGDRFCRNCGAELGTGTTQLRDTLALEGEPTAPVRQATMPAPPATLPPAPLATATVDPAPPAPTPSPEPPSAGAAPTGRSGSPVHVVALVGGALVLASLFLPWLSAGGESANAFEIVVQLLWDLDPGDGVVKIGTVLFVLGGLGGGLAFVPHTTAVRRVCGALVLVTTLALVVQVYRALDEVGGVPSDVLDTVGAGVYAALTGAVALIVSR